MDNSNAAGKQFKCTNGNCRKPIAPIKNGALVFVFGDSEIEVYPKKAIKIKCPFCGIHSLFKEGKEKTFAF
ncbi:MAG TPA: hypothetical protein VNI84_15720 [Pyrinomonadaceae bacterium]|nr:hypothetical protein [Pyrinomonadaceae bacterium]